MRLSTFRAKSRVMIIGDDEEKYSANEKTIDDIWRKF